VVTTHPEKSAMLAETADILHHTNVTQNLFQGPRETQGAGEG